MPKGEKSASRHGDLQGLGTSFSLRFGSYELVPLYLSLNICFRLHLRLFALVWSCDKLRDAMHVGLWHALFPYYASMLYISYILVLILHMGESLKYRGSIPLGGARLSFEDSHVELNWLYLCKSVCCHQTAKRGRLKGHFPALRGFVCLITTHGSLLPC